MKAQEIRAKETTQLLEDLMSLRKEQFNLRMQMNLKTSHEKKRNRRAIARIKTILVEKGTRV